MTSQFRLYTINKGELQQFADEWNQTVRPLRIVRGYKIPEAWLITERNQFAWILRYPGPRTWDEMERAYYASPARLAFDPDPARLIARAEQYFMKSV